MPESDNEIVEEAALLTLKRLAISVGSVLITMLAGAANFRIG